MQVSIVMTAFDRYPQLEKTLQSIFTQKHPSLEVIVVEDSFDGGHTMRVCRSYGAKYLRRDRPPGKWVNPAVANNMGIRAASGKVLIIQNAEIRHVTPHLITDITEPVLADPKVSVFPCVRNVRRNGEPYPDPDGWRIHPVTHRRPLFFCQAVDREIVVNMRGFDEDYKGYGYEDNDFADRLERQGVKWLFLTEVVQAEHQEHAAPPFMNVETNASLYESKKNSPFVRNQNREWGVSAQTFNEVISV
jgi:glycosyltransferase involved in cell wall biosynthesis